MRKMNTSKQSKYFLATTALEDYWDTTKPIVFLGKWCCRYNRRSFWEPLKGRTVKSPWEDREKFIDAYHYISDIYEDILRPLANTLNSIHNTDYSLRYWRILLGPWLQHFIPVIYDRFITIRSAMEQYPDFTSIGLPEKSFLTPRTSIDYFYLINKDSYNLQIYTKILKFFGKEFPRENKGHITDPFLDLAQSRPIFIDVKQFSTFKTKVKEIIKSISRLITSNGRNSQSIILKGSYFSRIVELKLFLKRAGVSWPSFTDPLELPFFPTDQKARSNLESLLPENNEFERFLNKTLAFDLPQCFIEGYDAIKKEVASNYPVKPKAIFSAVKWYYDETFKQWAALSAESGTILLGAQHGGRYGSLPCMPGEDHELAIVNRYYSWGWERTDCRARVIPKSASKLMGRKKLGADNSLKGLLYASTFLPRYLNQFDIRPNDFPAYLDWQMRFAKRLSPKAKTGMRVRLYYDDYGWGIAERWQTNFPNIPIEKANVPFLKSLANCRFYVCDHLSTTLLEVLAADQPTILFWNPEANPIRSEAQPYYNLLHKAGILFYNPEEAAETANNICDDVESWWLQPDRQTAREKFCHRFARTSPNAINEWTDEFRKINKGDYFTRPNGRS